MEKSIEIFGIDISKDTFDTVNTKGQHFKFENNTKGFRMFAKLLNKNTLVAIEATGYYHFCLAQFLSLKQYNVSVINPLSIKRFIQMKLSKIKTDKTDAKAICEYAQLHKVPKYILKSKREADCLQIMRLIDAYIKKRTAIKNKIHGEIVLNKPSKIVYHSLNRTLKFINKEIILLESHLMELIKEEFKDELKSLQSIPGIGIKTSLALIISTNGFKNFKSAKQLCSYIGITPIIRTSGSSVRGKSRISKIGNKKIRNLLFMCSFTASKSNKSCRELYHRIVSKGKSKKLALIAVCNKLLKQAFAIVKTGGAYNENHVSQLV